MKILKTLLISLLIANLQILAECCITKRGPICRPKRLRCKKVRCCPPPIKCCPPRLPKCDPIPCVENNGCCSRYIYE